MCTSTLRTSILAAFILGTLIITGCDSNDDSAEATPIDLVTQLVFSLQAAEDDTILTSTVTADEGLDGDANITVDALTLTAGMSYNGTLELFNDSDDLTNDLIDGSDTYQFFYAISGDVADAVTLDVTDTDNNGLPLGLTITLSVNAEITGEGTLQVQLSRYDDGEKDGVTLSDTIPVDVTIPLIIN